jgi:hypothetical protein
MGTPAEKKCPQYRNYGDAWLTVRTKLENRIPQNRPQSPAPRQWNKEQSKREFLSFKKYLLK